MQVGGTAAALPTHHAFHFSSESNSTLHTWVVFLSKREAVPGHVQRTSSPSDESNSTRRFFLILAGEMAEVAAASSAVGLVSFGLQMCGGIVKYCHAVKSQDADIATLSNRAEELTNILESVISILRPGFPGQTPTALQVENCVLSCGATIRKLEAKLMKYGPEPRTVVRQFRHVLYPLRKSDIDGVNDTLRDLQSNLTTALILHQTATRQEERAIGYIGQSVLHTQPDLSQCSTVPLQLQDFQTALDSMLERKLQKFQNLQLDLAI